MGETGLVGDAWQEEVGVWCEVHGGSMVELYGGWCIVELRVLWRRQGK